MNKKNPYFFGENKNASAQTGKSSDTTFISPEGLSSLGDLTHQGDVEDVDLRAANYLNAQNPSPEEAAQKVVIPMEGLTDQELKELAETRLCPHCTVMQEAENVRLRALAELDNTRKRLQREKEERVAYAAEAVLSDIIPALDNLDLALEHSRSSDACKDLVIGVDMTKKILLDSLKKHGLEAVGCVGESFDPALHEAVGMEAHPEVDADHVCRLLSKGYTLKGRLLRPARVVVSKK